MKALKQYAESHKNIVSEHQLGQGLGSQKGVFELGDKRKRDKKENEKKEDIFSKLENTHRTKVAVNEIWKDMIHEIESSTNDIEEIRNYALSMLFNLDQNEATASAIEKILSSSQKDDLVKALKQYAESHKNVVSEHQLGQGLGSQKGVFELGDKRKRDKKENEKKEDILSKLENTHRTKNLINKIDHDQKVLIQNILSALTFERKRGPKSVEEFKEIKEMLEDVMNQIGGDIPDIKNLGFKERWDIMRIVSAHYGIPAYPQGG